MSCRSRTSLLSLLALSVGACAAQRQEVKPPANAPSAASTAGKPATTNEPLTVPIQSLTLDNGLRVVLSRDPTAPVARTTCSHSVAFARPRRLDSNPRQPS